MKKNPKVSVCVVTYNQEKYIEKCLLSILEQKTNFDFEVIIGNDCSTDNTEKIIFNLEEKFPGKLRVFTHHNNIGAFENFKFVHEQAVGQYVAHVDGDDFTLPGKLQIQADFLDANRDCNIAFHRMVIADDDSDKYIFTSFKEITKYKFYRQDIIELVAVGGHSSKMYRKLNLTEKLPVFDIVDYTANVIHVGNGYAAYCCEEPLGVYRKGIGISGSPAVIQSVYKTLIYFKDKYPEYRNQINASAWGWLISNIKNKRPCKWPFFLLAMSTFSLNGLFKFIYNRFFRERF